MERRKRVQKILTYDDVLLRLRHTLMDVQRGGVACARLRERYDVVLVDEFQDTDPVQWEIMHSAFGRGGTTLVLIGDPKQAIYAFRGADVQAYLEARHVVETEWTLDVNWRSDEELLQAYDRLFAGAELGDAGITYRDIAAADANRSPRLVGLVDSAPLQVRIVHADDGLVPLTKTKGQPQAGDARALIARDLASEVVALLSTAPEVVVRRRDGSELRRSTLHPGHIAVLVRFNSHAVMVRDALQAAGVPAVIGGSISVFATQSAKEWLRLLEALERPTARDRASLAALTCFVGWTPEEVATATEEEWEDLHWSLHRWAALLRDEGIASLYETVSSSHDVPARVLAGVGGERSMTDLRHIGQLLHEAGVSEGLGPTAMATWLGRRIRDADKDTENEERARRLESDAAAVQVITIHRSKGLEFPIVLCPYMFEGRPQKNDVPVFHDPDNGHRRTIDVGQDGKGFAVHQKMELEEGRGEDLRLLYVALTRAQHRAVLWWAGVQDSEHSPLSRLLFDRDDDGVVSPYGATRRSDDEVEAAFAGLGPLVDVARVGWPAGAQWRPDPGVPPDLEPAVFDRSFDVALAAGVVLGHHPGPARRAGGGQRARAGAHVGRGHDRASRATARRSPTNGTPCPCTSVRCRGAPSSGPWCTAFSNGQTSRRPISRWRWAKRWVRSWPGATSTWEIPQRSSGVFAPRSSPRSARWPEGSVCVTWHAATASTSWASKSHWWEATCRRAGSTWRISPICCRRSCRRRIRSPATRPHCAIRRSAARCAAT